MIYGFQKLIEFDKIKSHFLTNLDFFAHSFVIFCFVLLIYFEIFFVSQIFIQFTQSLSSVKNLDIGLGEAHLTISKISDSFLTSNQLLLTLSDMSEYFEL
jgi:chemotaxis methyl-accepting protein methylase